MTTKLEDNHFAYRSNAFKDGVYAIQMYRVDRIVVGACHDCFRVFIKSRKVEPSVIPTFYCECEKELNVVRVYDNDIPRTEEEFLGWLSHAAKQKRAEQ